MSNVCTCGTEWPAMTASVHTPRFDCRCGLYIAVDPVRALAWRVEQLADRVERDGFITTPTVSSIYDDKTKRISSSVTLDAATFEDFVRNLRASGMTDAEVEEWLAANVRAGERTGG